MAVIESPRRPADPERLRICLVSPYDFAVPGGVGAHISNLARIFRRRGHYVKIMAPSSTPVGNLDTPGVVGISRTIVPVRSNGSIARLALSPRMRPAIERELAEDGGFDIVHIHEPMAPVLPLQVLRLSSAVNIGTFHATRKTSTVYRAYKPLLEGFHKRLDGKIAVSVAARDFVWRAFPGEYRIIPNGIDPEWFGTPAEPIAALAGTRPAVMFLGRMEKRKGLPLLLDAMETVRRLRPDARLVVVGAYDQGQLQRARRRLERAGIQDAIFTGRVSEDEKRAYLQSADILVAPAQGSARESQGIVLMEGMAAGTPVVASDIPGYRTVSPDGSAVLYCAPDDKRALARGILRLLQHPETADRFRRAGRQRVNDFSWEVVATHVYDYYVELLRARSRIQSEDLEPTAGRAIGN